jgi:hypothetical protein
MMAPEVLKELQPFVALADGLGRAAVQLVEDSGFADVFITYHSPRGDDLDSRLLRAMVIKGMLEQITTSQVNLVNADLLAKKRGLRIVETVVPAEGTQVLTQIEVRGLVRLRSRAEAGAGGRASSTASAEGSLARLETLLSFWPMSLLVFSSPPAKRYAGMMSCCLHTCSPVPWFLYGCLTLSPCPSSQVAVGASTSKFSSAVVDDRIEVAGSVKSGAPFLTRVGAYDVDLALEVGI